MATADRGAASPVSSRSTRLHHAASSSTSEKPSSTGPQARPSRARNASPAQPTASVGSSASPPGSNRRRSCERAPVSPVTETDASASRAASASTSAAGTSAGHRSPTTMTPSPTRRSATASSVPGPTSPRTRTTSALSSVGSGSVSPATTSRWRPDGAPLVSRAMSESVASALGCARRTMVTVSALGPVASGTAPDQPNRVAPSGSSTSSGWARTSRASVPRSTTFQPCASISARSRSASPNRRSRRAWERSRASARRSAGGMSRSSLLTPRGYQRSAASRLVAAM
jgi:hypothetical protein